MYTSVYILMCLKSISLLKSITLLQWHKVADLYFKTLLSLDFSFEFNNIINDNVTTFSLNYLPSGQIIFIKK